MSQQRVESVVNSTQSQQSIQSSSESFH